MSSYNTLERHQGHKIEIGNYGNGANLAVECLTCYEVIMDYDREQVSA